MAPVLRPGNYRVSSGIIFWRGIHSQLERFTVAAYPSAGLSGRSQEKPDYLGPLMRRAVTHTQVHPAGARLGKAMTAVVS